MVANESVLLQSIFFHCIFSILLLYGAYNFFNGVNSFNNKKITTQNRISRIFQTRIIPIVLILASIWFSGELILDYTIKDYQSKIGIIETINVVKGEDELYIKGEPDSYSLPNALADDVKKGNTYRFTYGKRSRIIIGIE